MQLGTTVVEQRAGMSRVRPSDTFTTVGKTGKGEDAMWTVTDRSKLP